MATLTKDQSGTYTIKPGDNLTKIASQYGTTVAALQSANGISNANAIQAGAKLKIPTVSAASTWHAPMSVPSASSGGGGGGGGSWRTPTAPTNMSYVGQPKNNGMNASFALPNTSGTNGSVTPAPNWTNNFNQPLAKKTTTTPTGTAPTGTPQVDAGAAPVPTYQTQTPAPQQSNQQFNSPSEVLLKMLKAAQDANLAQNASIANQQNQVNTTGMNLGLAALKNPNLTASAGTGLFNGGYDAVSGGHLGLNQQLALNNQAFGNQKDMINTAMQDYQAQATFDEQKRQYDQGRADDMNPMNPQYQQNSQTGQNQMTDNERALLTTFANNPIVKSYNEIISQKLSFDRVLQNGSGGPSDLASVFMFMKGLDPNSVVRETEYSTAANSGNIFSGWATKFNGYLKPNGGFLPPAVKAEFQNLVNQRLAAQQQQYDNFANSMRQIAINQGLNPDNVVLNFGGAVNNTGSTGGGNSSDPYANDSWN